MDFSKSLIQSLLQDQYGLEGTQLALLPGEMDANYRVETASGTYLLKVAHKSRNRDWLQYENRMMLQVSGSGQEVEVPQPVANQSGQHLTQFETEEGVFYARLLTWLDGVLWVNIKPKSSALLRDLGEQLGRMSQGLAGFDDPAAHRAFAWNILEVNWVRDHLHEFEDTDREMVDQWLDYLDQEWLPGVRTLRRSICYYDANDHNILVGPSGEKVTGFIDFGDAVYTLTMAEVAIACTYAMMGMENPLIAAGEVIGGYHKVFPLKPEEVRWLPGAIAARLLLSLTFSTIRMKQQPGNPYLQVSARPGWELLRYMSRHSMTRMHAMFRQACGWEAHPDRERCEKQLRALADAIQPVLPLHIMEQPQQVIDLSVGSLDLGHAVNFASAEAFTERFQQILPGGVLGVGRYLEPRSVYSTEAYQRKGNDGPEWRTIHLGLDLFEAADTPVLAPLAGEVYSVKDNAGDRDYGPTVILKHCLPDGLVFYTLYGHLSHSCFELIKPGQSVAAGQLIGHFGAVEVNGGWPPHLHFQILLDPLEFDGDFPGVGYAEELSFWQSISPDPSLMVKLKVPAHYGSMDQRGPLTDRRQQLLGNNLSLSYGQPLHIVRGHGAYLYDHRGYPCLDMVNNVAHVGHECLPVVRAGQRQMAVLNTNTRYLHRNILDFAGRLREQMPDHLEVVYCCNSGSEANELALRMAHTCTGSAQVMALEHGYHGNTNACVAVSSYKFDGPGGGGCPEHVHLVPMPDPYRGRYAGKEDAVQRYMADVDKAIEEIRTAGHKPGALIAESILSCGGQVVPEPGFLQALFARVKAAGGLCIADEVQTGCGRVGSHFWSFEAEGVQPDIVTIGKPIGNGHPLGVVVTTRAVAEAFANGMEYFNTFGGNPVSAAIGLAVLDVIQSEGLQQHAETLGTYLQSSLVQLQQVHPVIGHVRGRGLFLGIEFIRTDTTCEPAAAVADYVVNRMQQLGVLLSTDGPDHNVIKIKPPMVFDRKQADYFLDQLHNVLGETRVQSLIE